jgi:hypothetical protein
MARRASPGTITIITIIIIGGTTTIIIGTTTITIIIGGELGRRPRTIGSGGSASAGHALSGLDPEMHPCAAVAGYPRTSALDARVESVHDESESAALISELGLGRRGEIIESVGIVVAGLVPATQLVELSKRKRFATTFVALEQALVVS